MGSAISNALTDYEVVGFDQGDEILGDCDVYFLCVKPQALETVEFPDPKDKVVVSILAGTSIEKVQEQLGDAKLMRLMPNLCASIGRSINAYMCEDSLVDLAEELFRKFGKPFRVSNESDFNYITPLFGSGPAHMLYFLRSMKEFGDHIDVTEDLLIELMASTAEWVSKDGRNFDELIAAVTSKGGTTERVHEKWEDLDVHDYIVTGLEAGRKKEENF